MAQEMRDAESEAWKYYQRLLKLEEDVIAAINHAQMNTAAGQDMHREDVAVLFETLQQAVQRSRQEKEVGE